MLFYEHPKKHKKLGKEESHYIVSGQKNHQNGNSKRMSARSAIQILKRRQFWGIALPKFLAEPAWLTFNAFIPVFMFKVYGFDLKAIACSAWLPMLFADFGCITGGYLPPLFQKWFRVNLVVSRKLVVTIGAVLMIIPGTMGICESPYTAIMLFCIGGFAHQALSGALITLSSDVFGHNEVATANGLTGMVGWTGASLFSIVTGYFVDKVGFGPLFLSLSIFDLLGALLIWTILKNEVVSESY
jgi:ACS family hexuronate transporter-like MFS transporter